MIAQNDVVTVPLPHPGRPGAVWCGV